MNYTNFDTRENTFPSNTVLNPYYSSTLYNSPPSCRIRNFSNAGSTWMFGWGKNIGQVANTTNNTGSGGNWGQSNNGTNYLGNNSATITTSFDITLKKDLITNIYKWIVKSSNSNINFDSTSNALSEAVFPLNDDQLRLYNSSGFPTTTTLDVNNNSVDNILNPKITNLNFLRFLFRQRSINTGITTVTLSNFKINGNNITLNNQSTLTTTSLYGVPFEFDYYIPITIINDEFNIKFDMTVPQRNLFNTGFENNRIIFNFGIATPIYNIICVKDDTKILLSNKELKMIKDINKDDEIVTNKGNALVVDNLVCEINRKIKMVEFKKDSLDVGVPNEDTYITSGHIITFGNKRDKARKFINGDTIKFKKININNLHTLILDNNSSFYYGNNIMCKTHTIKN